VLVRVLQIVAPMRLWLLILVSSSIAHADPAQVAQAIAEQRYLDAQHLLEADYARSQDGALLLQLARVHRKLGNVQETASFYRRYREAALHLSWDLQTEIDTALQAATALPPAIQQRKDRADVYGRRALGLKIGGAITMTLGIIVFGTGTGIVVGNGFCGTEYGACERPSTIRNFQTGYGLLGASAGLMVGASAMFAVSAWSSNKSKAILDPTLWLSTESSDGKLIGAVAHLGAAF